MTNKDIARILTEMGAFYEMEAAAFKPRAYEKAAAAVSALDEQAVQIYKRGGLKGLDEISGVGKGIAEHIEELIKTGKLKSYEKFRKKYPVNLAELLEVESIGPKTVKTLYQKLGIRNLADLKKAVKQRKISKVSRFGKKSEEHIAKSLVFQDGAAGRRILGDIYDLAKSLEEKLQKSGHFEKAIVGGSFRRWQETVGDIDILAVAKDSKKATGSFVRLPEVERVIEKGQAKTIVKMEKGLQVDLRIVPRSSWGAALVYFTGDKSHNIKLRNIAIDKGWKLSEYGIFSNKKSKGKKQKYNSKFKTETEEQVYNALGMDYIEPELRTDSGEIEAAQKHKLPKLVGYDDIKGDLQIQTNWTDGANTIEQMATAAVRAGFEYIGITDHTKALAMTGGLDKKKLEKQMKEIDKTNSKLKSQESKLKILKGAEVNILKDGSLDIADKTLAKLDFVGVSVHSHFKLPRAEQTKRIVKALSNPNVNIFFHPTSRKINVREPINYDFDAVFRAAKKYKVALEANASPQRLDLHGTLVRKAMQMGVKLVINSDAHHSSHFEFMKFGIAQARRGWATKKDVINTKPVKELLKFFSKK